MKGFSMSNNRKILCIVISLLIIAGALLACGGSSDANTGTKAGTASTQSAVVTPTQAPATKFKQGDVVKVGDTWQVTVNSIQQYTSDNEYEQPKDGDMFVSINVTLKNISAKEVETNPYDFALRGGADGTKYDRTVVDLTSPEGKIEPGD